MGEVQLAGDRLDSGLEDTIEAEVAGDQPPDLVDRGDAGRALPLGREQPRVNDRGGQLVGDDPEAGGVVLGKTIAALDVQHAEHMVAADDRHRQLGADADGAGRGDIARVRCHIVDKLRLARPHCVAHNARADRQAMLAAHGRAVLAGEDPQLEDRWVVWVDQRDGDVRVAEQLVDGVRRNPQQVVERQVGRQRAPDPRHQRQLLGAQALVFVAAGVLDRGGGVAREQLQGGDILLVELAGRRSADAEVADHTLGPPDRHADGGEVVGGGQGRAVELPILAEHDRALRLEHRPGQAHADPDLLF